MRRLSLALGLALLFPAVPLLAQTCPVHPNLEIRISGLHCQFPLLPSATWSPCGLSSPVTLTLYDHDTGQPYHLQSCETGVNWIYSNEVSSNQYVTTTMPNQGTSIQVSSAAVGNSWSQAAVMSGATQTQTTNTYIPFANGIITTSAPKTTVTEGATAYVNVHTTYSPTSFKYTVTNYDNAAGRFTPVVTPVVVSFASGEYDKTIAVPTTDDSTAQGTGRIQVQVGDNNYDNGVERSPVAGPFDGFIFIADNDGPVFKWSQNSYTFAENAPNPSVIVTRSGDPNTTASVQYVIGPDIYSPAASGTLTFNAGETSKSAPVPIVNDNVWSLDRHWVAELRNPSANAYLGSSATPVSYLDVPITIVDDDSTGTLSINDLSVNEGNTGHTNATFNVTLSSAAASPFDVSLTYGGTALPGTDYVTPPASVHFDAGQTTVPVVVSVIGDTLVERDETVTATLSHVTGTGAIPAIGKPTGTLTILNDDSSMTSLKLAAGTTGHMTIYLGNPIQVTGTVSLTSSKPDVAAVPASFVAESGRSTIGFDVEALSAGESVITAKLPASLGGMTLTAMVDVDSDVVPGVIVTEVGPPNGPASGGTFVTIAGMNFTPACSVTFGDTPARTVSFVSTSALKAMIPAHEVGTADVTVECDGDLFTLADGFTFFTPTRSRGARH